MIKKMLFVVAFLGSLNLVKSQQMIDLENLSLPVDSFWNGSDNSGGFVANQIAIFPNNFVDWGGGITSWSGFAYSNMKDTTIQDFTNQYSNFAGSLLPNSHIFGISYNASDWNTGQIIPNTVSFSSFINPISMYVTNSTYTALTMKNGDNYSKKFGGITGNDPDWFKLTIIGMNDDSITGTIDFYLADYRFSDNNQDYIVKDWQNIDLTFLGTINKLSFLLSSSDTGIFGMNTPAYFCFDNILFSYLNNMNESEQNIVQIFPIPSNNEIYFTEPLSQIKIFNMLGQEILSSFTQCNSLNIAKLSKGQYILKAHSTKGHIQKMIIKIE